MSEGFSALRQDLQARLTADLPAMSPRLKAVALHCLAHARRLHLCRIQDVAKQCHTQPVTVVRLAKRYGYRGFLDFKMAFLEREGTAPGDFEPTQAAFDSASTAMTQCIQAVAQLDSEWTQHAVDCAVRRLQQAHTVWLMCTPQTQQVAQCHAQVLRLVGLNLQWLPQVADASTRAWQARDCDVIVFVAQLGQTQAYGDATALAAHHGLALVTITHGWPRGVKPLDEAHLCVPDLAQGPLVIAAALVLAQAVHNARNHVHA